MFEAFARSRRPRPRGAQIRIRSAPVAIIAFFLALTACLDLDSVDPPQQFVWEAQVSSPLQEDVPIFSGTVQMLTGSGFTDLAVQLEDAIPGTDFGWAVRSGSCEEPDALVASETVFEEFTIEPDGAGGIVQFGVHGEVREGLEYSAFIYRGEDDGGDLLVCREMDRIH